MMSAAGTQMKTEISVVQAYTAVLLRFLMSPIALQSVHMPVSKVPENLGCCASGNCAGSSLIVRVSATCPFRSPGTRSTLGCHAAVSSYS